MNIGGQHTPLPISDPISEFLPDPTDIEKEWQMV